MDLSILVLNYKAAKLVRQCLKTIKICDPQISYEVIVVDNCSNDGCDLEAQKEMPEVRFIANSKNLGFAAGNNLGLKEAKGRYVLFMNPDITVRPGSLDKMISFMDQNQDIGVCGPRLERGDGSADESCFRYPSFWTPFCRRTLLGKTKFGKKELDRYLMTDFDRYSTREVDWVLGAAMMVRKDVIKEVGPLDERYFLYFEDADWCRSFRESGWRVSYYPEAKMVHYHEKESAKGNPLVSLLKPAFRAHISSCFKYFQKWGWMTPPSIS